MLVKITPLIFFGTSNRRLFNHTFKKITVVETPYTGISEQDYQIEKRRLQLELLRIQKRLGKENTRLVVVFEGRDAAGKGSTIKRFAENMIPSHYRVIALGIPTASESKN